MNGVIWQLDVLITYWRRNVHGCLCLYIVQSFPPYQKFSFHRYQCNDSPHTILGCWDKYLLKSQFVTFEQENCCCEKSPHLQDGWRKTQRNVRPRGTGSRQRNSMCQVSQISLYRVFFFLAPHENVSRLPVRKYPIAFFDTPTRPELDQLPGILSNTRPDQVLKNLPPGQWSFARGRSLQMIICKRPDPLDDHLQVAGSSRWSFESGRILRMIICERPDYPDDHL